MTATASSPPSWTEGQAYRSPIAIASSIGSPVSAITSRAPNRAWVSVCSSCAGRSRRWAARFGSRKRPVVARRSRSVCRRFEFARGDRSGLDDRDRVDLDLFGRRATRVVRAGLVDRSGDVESGLNRSELRVLDPEAGATLADHDEPLAAVRVGAAVRHGDRALAVRAWILRELVLERVAGSALSRGRS